MAYLDHQHLMAMGFKRLGVNVKISDKASIYDADRMEIGDHSRIDDFCVISGSLIVGRYCHITPMCLIAGGAPGINFSDFCTLAYGVKIFAQSDDYSGCTMTNSLIPKKYKREIFASVTIGRHAIIGAGSVVFPGADIAEGCAIGAMTLVTRPTEPWGVYVGIPAYRLKSRRQDLLELEKMFHGEVGENSV